MVGEKTKEKFRLGDDIKIKVTSIDLDQKKIDMDLVKEEKNKKTLLGGS
jgi:ribonuclease R